VKFIARGESVSERGRAEREARERRNHTYRAPPKEPARGEGVQQSREEMRGKERERF